MTWAAAPFAGIAWASTPSEAGGPVAGTLAASESGADQAAFYQTVPINGTLSVSESGGDAAAASGIVRNRSLRRQTNGLLARDDFSSLSGWTASAGWTADSTRPIYLAYTSDVAVLTGGAIGSTDGSGPREGHLMQVSSALWYLWYGAGDGNTSGAGAPWRPQLAKSTDKGVNWTKLGAISGVTNGSYAARDNSGYPWKDGSTGLYYMHVLNADNQAFGIPDVTYHNAIYSASDPEGTWTFVRETPPPGGAGDFDEVSVNVTWTEKIGSTYHHYWSARTANVALDPAWAVGHGTSSTPDGVITKDGLGNFMGTSVTGTNRSRPENAKKWLSDELGKYILASNVVDPSGNFTRANDIWYADSQTDFKNNVYRSRAQDIDWPGYDGANAVGLICPFCDEAGQAIQVDGYVPFTWDADPPSTFGGGSNVGFHRGRRIRAGVLEPAAGSAKAASNASPQFLVKSQSNSDFVAEFALELPSTAPSGLIGFAYRMSANAGDSYTGYLLSVDVGSNALALHRNDGAGYTLIGSASRTAVKSEDSINLYVERWKIVVSGSTHSLYLNGETTPTLTASDATYSSGSYVAFRSTTDAKIRLFGLRSSDSVTINGLTPGDSVVLRGHGDVVIATATADGSGVATLTNKHYPLYGFTVNGTDYQPTDGGLVWGGDTFAMEAIDQASLAANESGSDTAALSGQIVVQGSIAGAESGTDTAAFSGSGPGGISGTLAATEAGSDISSMSGQIIVAGLLATTESGADTALFNGGSTILGTLAVTEGGGDSASMSGSVSGGISGTFAATESGADTAAFDGRNLAPINGDMAASESGSDAAHFGNFRFTANSFYRIGSKRI
jgi:hypothetical protein